MSDDNYAPYSIELIRSALCARKARFVGGHDSPAEVKGDDLDRALLPYLLEEVEPGWLLPLNRDYKPIGLLNSNSRHRSGGWADYNCDKYRPLLLPKKDVDLTLLKIVRPEIWYFYNDGNSPFSWTTAADRRKYHLKLWWTFRHWRIPLPAFSAQLLASAKKLGVDDALLDHLHGRVAV